MAISHMEDMLNEVFFEIFDYLDGCDIINAFFYLNIRFRHIIQNSSLLMKIKLCSDYKSERHGIRKQVIIPYKHQISSLHLQDNSIINRFFIIYPINLAFHRLESLNLDSIKTDKLLPLLYDLYILPRLFRLIINLEYDQTDFNNTYQLVFNLPVLIYNRLSSQKNGTLSLLPINTTEKFSSLEYLVIDHPCTDNELITLLSYTPKLRRLICKKSLNKSLELFKGAILSNLTHIYIKQCCMQFHEFEIFISELSSQLQVLQINTFNHPSYLDADRWEQLILKHMPHLRKFYFEYHESFRHPHQLTSYHSQTNQFIEPFWTERHWIFDIIIDLKEVIYSIQPYRKRWFEFEENGFDLSPNASQNTDIINSSTQLHKDISLTIAFTSFQQYGNALIDTINSLLAITQITHLDINCSNILLTTFIKFINVLPNLNSLKISYVPIPESKYSIGGQVQNIALLQKNQNITKIHIEHMSQFEQVQFLLDLFPNIRYLIIDCTNDIDLKLLVRFIPLKNVRYLRLLCLYIPSTDNELIKTNLQKMIDFEHLNHYTIDSMDNKIYIQRKLQ